MPGKERREPCPGPPCPSQPEVSKGPLKRGSSSKAFLFLAMQRPAPARTGCHSTNGETESSKRPTLLSFLGSFAGSPSQVQPFSSPTLPKPSNLPVWAGAASPSPQAIRLLTCVRLGHLRLASGHDKPGLALRRAAMPEAHLLLIQPRPACALRGLDSRREEVPGRSPGLHTCKTACTRLFPQPCSAAWQPHSGLPFSCAGSETHLLCQPNLSITCIPSQLCTRITNR